MNIVKGKKLAAFFVILFLVLAGVYYILDPEIKKLDETERKKLGGTYIDLSYGVTHYELTGPSNGKVVVLVHGGTVPLWTWDSQIKVLNDAGFRTLSYDKYGRGYSDRPGVTYDQQLYTNQLFELVDRLELTQKFDLIGISLGGATAVNFTAQYPDRVQKLVLISPLIKNFRVPSVFQIPVIGEFTARVVGTRILIARFTSLFEDDPEFENYKARYVEQTTYKGFQRSLLSMLRNDALGDYTNAYKNLGKQNRDILLVWGTEDKEVTREMIKSIRSFLPNVDFKPVEGLGHGLLFQEPEIISSLIIDFLH